MRQNRNAFSRLLRAIGESGEAFSQVTDKFGVLVWRSDTDPNPFGQAVTAHWAGDDPVLQKGIENDLSLGDFEQ